MDTNIMDFIKVLNDEIDSRFPCSQRVIVAGGDYISDCVMELRQGSNRLQYKPYEMFVNANGNYEDCICEFCDKWKRKLG